MIRVDVRRGLLALLHHRPAQVEVAVVDAQRLVHALLVELEGQRLGGPEHLERATAQLDLAGLERAG